MQKCWDRAGQLGGACACREGQEGGTTVVPGKVADGTRNGRPNDTCRCTPCFPAQLRPAQPDVNKV